MNPKKSNVSGLSCPRRRRRSAAYRPNSISRVLSGCNDSPNFGSPTNSGLPEFRQPFLQICQKRPRRSLLLKAHHTVIGIPKHNDLSSPWLFSLVLNPEIEGDRDGFAVWSKRLEEGTYAVPFPEGGAECRRAAGRHPNRQYLLVLGGLVHNSFCIDRVVCGPYALGNLDEEGKNLSRLKCIPGVLWLLSLIVVRAGAAVIDFEILASLESVTSQFAGLTFSNSTTLTAGISLNEFDFPPHSGDNVVSDDGGPITIFSAHRQSRSPDCLHTLFRSH